MRSQHNDFENLKASFQILQRNDSLLKRMIESENINTIYSEILKEYFNVIFQIDDENIFNKTRIDTILNALEKMWVDIHRKEKTKLIFDDYSDFEKNLFVLPYYRGHFIHQFNVFLLGYYILNKIKPYINLNDCKKIFDKTIQHENFVWMLTSTFHDMGYPIEKMEELFIKYFEMFLKVETTFSINIEQFITNNFNDYIKYLSEYHFNVYYLGDNNWQLNRGSRTDHIFQNKLYQQLRRKDHGLLSALLLLHSLFTKEKLLNATEWINRDLPYWIMPACHAITLHTLYDREFKIKFEKFPYAYLLVLCDAIQDWGRDPDGNDKSILRDIEIVFNECIIIKIKIEIKDENKRRELKEIYNQLESDLINIEIEF